MLRQGENNSTSLICPLKLMQVSSISNICFRTLSRIEMQTRIRERMKRRMKKKILERRMTRTNTSMSTLCTNSNCYFSSKWWCKELKAWRDLRLLEVEQQCPHQMWYFQSLKDQELQRLLTTWRSISKTWRRGRKRPTRLAGFKICRMSGKLISSWSKELPISRAES